MHLTHQQIEYTIEYVYGPYSGTERVTLPEDDERDPVQVMWGCFRRDNLLTLPMAATSARIVNRRLVPQREMWAQ